MSARLTVVLDDEDLYRRLKVRAAQDGVSMKELVEAGLRQVLGETGRPEREKKLFDWDRYEALLEKFRQEDEELGDEALYPANLSDVKQHLYGHPGAAHRRALRLAEEPADQDAP